jgi:hypothetical protein
MESISTLCVVSEQDVLGHCESAAMYLEAYHAVTHAMSLDAVVQVTRGDLVLASGATYVPGETLHISLHRPGMEHT